MATGTRSRTGRTSGAGQGRFARSTSTPRRTSPTQGLRRRRQPEPSGIKKVMGAVLPATAAKKATPSSKKGKAGGFALVAAAAGMAFKNREKLSQLRHKDSTGSAVDASVPGPTTATTNASSPGPTTAP
jgi:hypothetical protein